MLNSSNKYLIFNFDNITEKDNNKIGLIENWLLVLLEVVKLIIY